MRKNYALHGNTFMKEVVLIRSINLKCTFPVYERSIDNTQNLTVNENIR